jgi:hypothetical protein
MEALIAVAAGASFKVVDEIEDLELLKGSNYNTYSKTLCTAFITLWLYTNPYVNLWNIAVLVPACAVVDQIDNAYWKSLVVLPFILFFLTASNLQIPTLRAATEMIGFSLFMAAMIVLEDKCFPEEISTKKIISRILAVFGIGILIYLTRHFESHTFISSILYFSIGYYSTSLLSKYILYLNEETKNTTLP